MSQQTSPWLEGAYGWNFGENNWNTGIDQNQLKFSFMFDRNVDSIVASLPAAVNGQAHYLTTDNRIYFAVGTTFFSTPVPKWFIIVVRGTGQTHQFNGTSLVQIDTTIQLDSRLDAVELTVSTLGTAAFQTIEFFATQTELDVAEGVAAAYTDDLRSDLADNATAAEGAGQIGFGSAVSYPASTVGERLTAISNAADSTKGSSLVGYLPSGTNFVSRNVQTKLRETISVGDYTTLVDAKTAAANKIVVDPDGILHKDVFNQSHAIVTEAVDPLWKAGEIYRSSSSGSHIGTARIAKAIELRPVGSGDNGPTNADYGESISVIKQDFFNTTTRGEIDGLAITVRQGGRAVGGISDCAGLLLNVGTVHGTGWAGAIEAQTSTFDTVTAALAVQVQTAVGVLDSSTASYYGFTATANVGAIGAAYFANLSGTGSFTNFLEYRAGAGTEVFKVDGFGRVVLRAGSGATPSKTIRALNTNLSILNDAQTTEIFVLGDSGNASIPGSFDTSACVVRGGAFGAGAGTVVYGGTTSTTATAGVQGAPPAQVSGYIIVNISNSQVKIPFYEN